MPGDVDGSRALPAHLLAAVKERGDRDSLTDEKSPDALGAVELVRAEAEEIHRDLAHVHRDLPDGLRGVRVEKDAVFPAQGGKLLDRENQARFVVGPHDGDKRRAVGMDVGLQGIPVDDTVAVQRQVSHLDAQLFQVLAGVRNAGMLDGSRDDLRFLPCPDQLVVGGFDHGIVGFSGAAGDQNVVAVTCVDPRVQPVEGDPHVIMDLGGKIVQAVRVAVHLAPERIHSLLHPGINDGGGVVIKVDPVHARPLYPGAQ